jgi:pyruvate/2-oxoglutarate/acetoin dehydrogenase E1 component
MIKFEKSKLIFEKLMDQFSCFTCDQIFSHLAAIHWREASELDCTLLAV